NALSRQAEPINPIPTEETLPPNNMFSPGLYGRARPLSHPGPPPPLRHSGSAPPSCRGFLMSLFDTPATTPASPLLLTEGILPNRAVCQSSRQEPSVPQPREPPDSTHRSSTMSKGMA